MVVARARKEGSAAEIPSMELCTTHLRAAALQSYDTPDVSLQRPQPLLLVAVVVASHHAGVAAVHQSTSLVRTRELDDACGEGKFHVSYVVRSNEDLMS